jgi:hypothetical protein
MLTNDEREHLNFANGDSDVFGAMVHALLDQGRIEALPEAESNFLLGCEANKAYKQAYIRSNWIVGPITNRYILPGLGPRLSKAEKAFPKWSLDPANRYADRLLEAMHSGTALKKEADKIISEIQASVA